MRRTPRLLLALAVALLAPLMACSDDDGEPDRGGGGGAAAGSDRVSTEGVCAALPADRASEVMGATFDEAVSAEGSCTYTSSTSQTAITLQVTDRGTDDPALVLETMGASCDPDTRDDRRLDGAEGGFSCLAGGVPNVVAVGRGVVLVLTGNSREEGVTPEAIVADLAVLAEEALGTYDES